VNNADNPAAIYCVAADEFVTECPLGGAFCLDFLAEEPETEADR
jgi:hypothetical protein